MDECQPLAAAALLLATMNHEGSRDPAKSGPNQYYERMLGPIERDAIHAGRATSHSVRFLATHCLPRQSMCDSWPFNACHVRHCAALDHFLSATSPSLRLLGTHCLSRHQVYRPTLICSPRHSTLKKRGIARVVDATVSACTLCGGRRDDHH